jgi:hypothetical protein
MMQDTQDPNSKPAIETKDVKSSDSLGSNSNHEGPIRKASNTTDKEDDNLIYDCDRFRVDKARCQYELYYHDCRIVVERGVDVANIDACAPRVQAVLEA